MTRITYKTNHLHDQKGFYPMNMRLRIAWGLLGLYVASVQLPSIAKAQDLKASATPTLEQVKSQERFSRVIENRFRKRERMSRRRQT